MNQSQALFREAQTYFPGGVNSPVRAFAAVGGFPLFIKKGKGAWITDEDGNSYVDYVLSWGPLILGHCPKNVVKEVKSALEEGSSFGAPTKKETQLAALITQLMPNIELLRFVSSGTEAAMSAIRLARGFTKRDLVVKFAGCYHGSSDFLLAAAGSGVATLKIEKPGVPAAAAGHTACLPYNDLNAVKELFKNRWKEIACVIVEPVAGNMGLVPPLPGFLENLRALCDRAGALLIFDEVMSGFRVAPGGAQELYGVAPDLTCLGKVIGGGFPVGAYGGKREIMEMVAPLGPVYQAGTLSGNPVAMSAGIATLKEFKQGGWKKAEFFAVQLEKAWRENLQKLKLELTFKRLGTMFCQFFNAGPVENLAQAEASDLAAFRLYFHSMLNQGVYLPPSQFESCFTSSAHGAKELHQTAKAHYRSLAELKKKGILM